MKRIITILLILILFASFTGCTSITSSSSGIKFKEVGYFKAGPGEKGNTESSNVIVKTIYVENFKDDPTVWADIESYAKNSMWSPGGITILFFFNNKANTPGNAITHLDYKTAINLPMRYNEYCIANYYHWTTGKEKFTKYPPEGQ